MYLTAVNAISDVNIIADKPSAAANTWTYAPPLLTLKWGNGFTDMVYVQKGRDWENKKNTVVFTGLNNMGTAVWGKKK